MASYAPQERPGEPRQVVPRPKPEKRLKAADWGPIREHFEGKSCLACWSTEIELHHVCPRSQSGSDVIENLAPLCHRHHMMIEDHSQGWRLVASKVREYVLDDNGRTEYMLASLGQARFDSRYPSLECKGQVSRDFNIRAQCCLMAGHDGPCQTLSDETYRERRDDYMPSLDEIEGYGRA